MAPTLPVELISLILDYLFADPDQGNRFKYFLPTLRVCKTWSTLVPRHCWRHLHITVNNKLFAPLVDRINSHPETFLPYVRCLSASRSEMMIRNAEANLDAVCLILKRYDRLERLQVENWAAVHHRLAASGNDPLDILRKAPFGSTLRTLYLGTSHHPQPFLDLISSLFGLNALEVLTLAGGSSLDLHEEDLAKYHPSPILPSLRTFNWNGVYHQTRVVTAMFRHFHPSLQHVHVRQGIEPEDFSFLLTCPLVTLQVGSVSIKHLFPTFSEQFPSLPPTLRTLSISTEGDYYHLTAPWKPDVVTLLESLPTTLTTFICDGIWLPYPDFLPHLPKDQPPPHIEKNTAELWVEDDEDTSIFVRYRMKETAEWTGWYEERPDERIRPPPSPTYSSGSFDFDGSDFSGEGEDFSSEGGGHSDGEVSTAGAEAEAEAE